MPPYAEEFASHNLYIQMKSTSFTWDLGLFVVKSANWFYGQLLLDLPGYRSVTAACHKRAIKRPWQAFLTLQTHKGQRLCCFGSSLCGDVFLPPLRAALNLMRSEGLSTVVSVCVCVSHLFTGPLLTQLLETAWTLRYSDARDTSRSHWPDVSRAPSLCIQTGCEGGASATHPRITTFQASPHPLFLLHSFP